MESKVRYIFINSFIVLLFSVSVAGKECRNLKTVAASAQSVAANTAAGGHIWQHVLGPKPSKTHKTETQKDKTLFASETDFKNAWKKFQTKSFKNLQLKQCKGGKIKHTSDCVRAPDIGVKLAYRCTAVDKSKVCTDYKKTKATYVEFWYELQGGKWVLNTAYPSASNTANPACKKTIREAEERKSKTFEALLLKLLKFNK